MTLKRLIAIYIFWLVGAAYVYSEIEHKTFFESLYWASVTATTIGYGDLLPTQTSTRILTILFAHFQVFFCIPSIIALILGGIIKDRNRFTHKEQEWMEDAIEKMATKLNIQIEKAPDGDE